MKAVVHVLRFLLRAAPWAMARGALLSITVLLMGAALLGLSGWFITASGLAGLAGIGIGFDFFRPSAGVRFLALGRAAARYGERLLTHDATLRALAKLRVRLLEQEATRDARGLMQLRSEGVLTRIVADVDALDGLALRLLLPVMAALLAHVAVFWVLGWLVGWQMAWAILIGYVPLAALILWRLGRGGLHPSHTAEIEAQSLRRGIIDVIRDREALILRGRIGAREDALLATDEKLRAAARRLDEAERSAGFRLSVLVTVVAGAALAIGGWLVTDNATGAAVAAIGVFVALALAETVLPLRRGFAELGRMAGAARRIGGFDATQPLPPATPPSSDHPPSSYPSSEERAPILAIRRPDFSLDLRPGEAAALTGASGIGKTTLLLQIAGLLPMTPHDGCEAIAVLGRSPRDWEETAVREIVTMVPQRSALLRGSVRENLALAADATDAEMWAALAAADLHHTLDARGGLDTQLGEAGAGLSGGQARRLCLARAVLKRPRLLLLDEPTEGLDDESSHLVLIGIRRALPDAAIVAALHRGSGHPVFGQRYALSVSPRI
ncbi:amino acid ABC transporter ATP-binding/permease protein [Methyloceanibacter caenitepidi]|uniref:Transport ATP-binding protein CydC n=1 Tax=Methyloceanibacter caenitepidi TaxID=1384459 RepID=A0A0A8K7E9_9HYPH|nr:ATP-binding cassette domain-containing protein [Methyloceanibacter caenitepidi]BAQ18741.1 transport ATP-binding protein CydC [Methyloceanibacter caenitepidi]